MVVCIPIGIKVHWSGCDKDRKTGKHVPYVSERDVHITFMQLHDTQPRFHIVFRDDKGKKEFRWVASEVLSTKDAEADSKTWHSEPLCF